MKIRKFMQSINIYNLKLENLPLVHSIKIRNLKLLNSQGILRFEFLDLCSNQ